MLCSLLILRAGTTLLSAQEAREINGVFDPTGSTENAVSDVSIKQESISVAQGDKAQIQAQGIVPAKQRTKGPSILRGKNLRAKDFKPSSNLPKNRSEAQKMGWKEKIVRAPQSIESLVKETPAEVKAKKARQKARIDASKKKNDRP